MIYFIDENFLKTNTSITGNVDARDLAPFIPITCKLMIEPILGYTFTNHLLSAFNNGTLTTDETTLVGFIKYTLAYYSAYEAIPSLSFRISSKGVQSQRGDYSDAVGIAEIEYLRNGILKTAKSFEGNLRNYLRENKSLFPLYKDPTNESITSPDQGGVKNNTTWL